MLPLIPVESLHEITTFQTRIGRAFEIMIKTEEVILILIGVYLNIQRDIQLAYVRFKYLCNGTLFKSPIITGIRMHMSHESVREPRLPERMRFLVSNA